MLTPALTSAKVFPTVQFSNASALGLGYNNWWVRTGSNSFDTDVYYSDDKGDASYEIFVTMTANGVVPAMWITL